MPTTKNRSCTLAVALLCASLLGGCANSLSAHTTPSAISPTTPDTMNSPNDNATVTLRVVDQLIAALKTERMLEAGFYEPAALTVWFGPHKLTSSLSQLKANVQIDVLDFEAVVLDVTHIHTEQATAMHFSIGTRQPWGLVSLSADRLIANLGRPQKTVDFIEEQLKGVGNLPAVGPNQLPISPPLLRTRGETTHPMGNKDISWQWNAGLFLVELTAKINGDGTVSSIFGRQGASRR